MWARDAAEARTAALNEAKKGVGTAYDNLTGVRVPVDPDIQQAMAAAGRKVRGQDIDLGLVHKVRSNLLAEARATKNAAIAHDKRAASEGLTRWLETQQSWIRETDSDYAFLTARLKAARESEKIIKNSLGAHGTNRAAGMQSGSVGGTLPLTGRGAVGTVFHKILEPSRSQRAKAIASLLLTPQRDVSGLEGLVTVHNALQMAGENHAATVVNALALGATAPSVAGAATRP